jgi:ABC-type transport system involved in cytochrome c biogenesis permease subunit
MPDLGKWYEKKKEDRTVVEHQLVELFMKIMNYYQVSRSFSGFFKELAISDPKLAAEFDLAPNQKVSYFHFIKYNQKLRSLVSHLNVQDPNELKMTEKDRPLFDLLQQLQTKIQDQQAQQLTIIPDQSGESEAWFSPWHLMGTQTQSEALTDFQISRLTEIQNIYDNMINGDLALFEKSITTFNENINQRDKIDFEVFFSKADFFMLSHICYIISIMLLMYSWLKLPKVYYIITAITVGVFFNLFGDVEVTRAMTVTAILILFTFTNLFYKSSLGFLILGLILHTAGLLSRMYIMGRPPVSTLYESIIFVGFVAVLLCLIFEYCRKNGLGIFSGTILGIILHFIGFGYASEGDTMGMLVAVLNSNFWLGTHVVTITMGYGCSLVAGIVGHLYLFEAIVRPKDNHKLKDIYNNMIGLTLIALLFTTIGTILGGIWADQSWGRFWGWDPKENGAMLICLWQMVLLHGRLGGLIKAPGFAFGLIINNIVVALAWFGVNLLNVGLHNYGFTEAIAYNLSIFCGIEIVLGTLAFLLAKYRQKTVLA